MSKRIPNGRPVTAAVALPASTGAGVVQEVSTVDALRLGAHQNDDVAGDLAADIATRPVAVLGAVVEPVNPALASEPVITGDAAGDAAIEVAGASAEFIQPVAVSMETLRPDTYAQSAFLADHESGGLLDNPARSTTPVEVGAGDTASPAAVVTGVDLSKGDDLSVEYVIFDLTRPPTQEERDNLKLVLRHLGSNLLDLSELSDLKPLTIPETLRLTSPTPVISAEEIMRQVDSFGFERDFPRTAELLGDWRATEGHDHPALRVTSKVAGFRRGGMAHPAEPVDHPVGLLQPHQIEAFLDEPMLVVELI